MLRSAKLCQSHPHSIWAQARAYRSRSLRPIPGAVTKPENSEPVLLEEKTVDFYLVGSSAFGQLGEGDISNFPAPKKIPTFEGLKISKIFVTPTAPHSFAITDDGNTLYSWGFNQAGQLGLGHREIANKPTVVKSLLGQKILDVFCGPITTFIKTAHLKTGVTSIWHTGSGFGEVTPVKQFTKQTTLPIKLPMHTLREKPEIVKIAPSASFCLMLDDQGRVYSFGTSDVGALGHGQTTGIKDLNQISSPELIPALKGIKVVDIQVGWNFAMVLTDKGDLFAWGINENGQCGFGLKTASYYEPRKLTFFNDIDVVQVACGADHTLVRDSNNHVYSWGNFASGRLGLNAEVDVLYPTKIDYFDDYKITCVSAGYAHSGAVSEDGDLWLWGNGEVGQLTQVAQGRDAFIPMKLPRPKFSLPESIQGKDRQFVRRGKRSIDVTEFTDLIYDHKVVDVTCGTTLSCITIESILRENCEEILSKYHGNSDDESSDGESTEGESTKSVEGENSESSSDGESTESRTEGEST